jgi:hypothetical protein
VKVILSKPLGEPLVIRIARFRAGSVDSRFAGEPMAANTTHVRWTPMLFSASG